jgi:hypothetical protein
VVGLLVCFGNGFGNGDLISSDTVSTSGTLFRQSCEENVISPAESELFVSLCYLTAVFYVDISNVSRSMRAAIRLGMSNSLLS